MKQNKDLQTTSAGHFADPVLTPTRNFCRWFILQRSLYTRSETLDGTRMHRLFLPPLCLWSVGPRDVITGVIMSVDIFYSSGNRTPYEGTGYI